MSDWIGHNSNKMTTMKKIIIAVLLSRLSETAASFNPHPLALKPNSVRQVLKVARGGGSDETPQFSTKKTHIVPQKYSECDESCSGG